MKKTISVLSVIALALAGLCLAVLILCVGGQKILMSLYTQEADVLGQFIIPAAPILYALGIIVASVLLVVGIKVKGFWIEILTTSLVAVMPVLQSLVAVLQTTLTGLSGDRPLVALSIMNSLCNYPLAVGQLAGVLVLLVCGMSIAYKKMQ